MSPAAAFRAVRHALALVGLLLALVAGPALAQQPLQPPPEANSAADQQRPDYEEWSRTANRAEEAIQAGRASNVAFEALRAQIADWRQVFLDAQNANKARIDTIKQQIDALGPAPGEGESEPAEIAERRKELNAQLEKLRAPVVAAEEAYARANGLVSEIDRIIRDRQSRELLSRGPSPLNPVHWPGALTQVSGASGAVIREVANGWGNTVQRDAVKSELPKTLVLALVGIVLLLRGRAWAKRIGERAHRQLHRGRGVWEFLISLGQVVLPLLGIVVLEEALFSSGLIGLRSTVIVDGLSRWGATLLIGWWLAGRLFPEGDKQAAVNIGEGYRAGIRFNIEALSVLLVVQDVIERVGEAVDFTPETDAVAGFPVIVVSALLLYRLTHGLRLGISEVFGEDTEASETAIEQNYRLRIISVLSRLGILVAYAAPLMAATGYGAAATALIYPSILTLALFGAVLILQQLVTDLYSLVMKTDDGAGEALLPVIVGFILTLAALPVVALVWGARLTSLLEIWTQFREGFVIGDTRISPTDFLTFALVFAMGYVLTRMMQGALRGSVLPKTKIDQGGQNAIVAGMGYVGIFLAAVIAITAAGIDLSSLAIVAGALSVGIGFGLQNIVSNFVSGIILLIERPISEGDWIEVGGQHGYVKSISVRSTRIETFDRTDVIVPNADLISGTVTNYTRGNTVGRVIVPVGVAYGSDTHKVEEILLEIGKAHPMVALNPPPYVLFRGFGADALNFEIRAILRDVNWVMNVHSEMNHQIAARFAEEGIEIPFAQRDVWLRNPEVLKGD
ncbi:DUF3772 domain-containing protein [Sediminimonas qiaohouensis]|uniref:DUF3772 domain-containing protein n=1 Tax=Sediminimonas qiaohouensis TaxID=552061 RepID=UPI000424FAF2|nr:DUF3772 domain-containing protein [Sediminimonas qiaohouensis]